MSQSCDLDVYGACEQAGLREACVKACVALWVSSLCIFGVLIGFSLTLSRSRSTHVLMLASLLCSLFSHVPNAQLKASASEIMI